MKVLETVEKCVSIFGNLASVFGGCLAVYALFYPEAVGTYLARLNEKADVILESVPQWPLIEGVDFSFEPPRFAGPRLTVSNPKNLVVKDFEITGALLVDNDTFDFTFGLAAPLLPPSETMAFEENVIRQPWFMLAQQAETFEMLLCVGGELERAAEDTPVAEKQFFEGRRYAVDLSRRTTVLVERLFGKSRDVAC